MERVSTIRGNSPILIIVPHGFDDPNTAVVGETIIKELDAYGVINRGWERANDYDYYADKANCNNISHCMEDVVKEEFFDPIINYIDAIANDLDAAANLFIIHGVSNSIRSKASDLDLIIGFGDGTPPSYTCDQWFLDIFLNQLDKQGFHPYQGKAGGQYSARRKQNLNQLFRLWEDYENKSVFSVQIEVVRRLRDTTTQAELTGMALANAIEDVVNCRNSNSPIGVPVNNYPSI
jgi:hypothetical protein